MKTIVSKYIIGVILLSGLCLGSLNTFFIAHADNSHQEMSHEEADDNKLDCCDTHETQEKLLSSYAEKETGEELDSPIADFQHTNMPQPNSLAFNKIHAPPKKGAERQLKSVIRLE